ncbi:MAG: type IV pili methyl-accepting chemotaxis transducer N-terminal domain-containing protein [Reinekea sp.]
MFKFTRYPISALLILTLLLVASLSFVASLYTLWMTSVISGDAKAINLSGSLRMQSYRIAYAIERDADLTERTALLQEFEQRLNSDELRHHIPVVDPELQGLFNGIATNFARMQRQALEEPHLYLENVESFVRDIDHLVARLESWSESKIQRLQKQQILLSVITLFAAALFALVIFKRVMYPLQSLMDAVIQMGRGNRTARSSYLHSDEFGDLSRTFNFMAEEVAYVYGSMENKIKEQTHELKRQNDVLQFLFDLSQSLSLDNLEIQPIRRSATDELMRLCPQTTIQWDSTEPAPETEHFVVPSSAEQMFLICKSGQPLLQWQQGLLVTVVDLFDHAINRMGSYKNKNRVALLNERTAIASELHDSLAQQLSYLKIQVVRFIKLRERDADETTLNEIIEELRAGLNSSYRKLRELLVTFRSQSEEPGLVPSVQAAADEINRISPNTKVHLYIDEHWPKDLLPSHEIHCLHVIREALTNVIKHAQAENVVVSLTVLTNNELEIKINDDGIGFDDSPEKPMHYGLKIMTERAERIGGQISYQRLKRGGAGVTLTFTSNSRQEPEPL